MREASGKTIRKDNVSLFDYMILYKLRYFSPRLNKLERNILHYIGDNEPVSRKDLDEEINEDASTIQRSLDAFRILDLITVTRGRGHELTRSGRARIADIKNSVRKVKTTDDYVVRADDLARGIRKVLKGEKYRLEANQIVEKLGGEIDLQEEISRSRSVNYPSLAEGVSTVGG